MKSVFIARPVRIKANSRDCFEIRFLPWPGASTITTFSIFSSNIRKWKPQFSDAQCLTVPCSCGFLILVLDQALDRDKMWGISRVSENHFFLGQNMLLKCYFGPFMYELTHGFLVWSFWRFFLSFFHSTSVIREEVGRSSLQTSPSPSMSGIPVHAPLCLWSRH